MAEAELEEIVRLTLVLAKAHWVRTGTAVRPEDAPLVAAEVRQMLAQARAPEN